MKRVTSVLAAAALALVVGASSAQAQTLVVGVGGGAILPQGDLNDVAKLGYHGAAMAWYILPSNLGFRADLIYARVPADKDALGVSGNFKLMTGVANVSYMFKGSKTITPYVIGSLGYFSVKFEDADADNNIGFGGGAGILINTGGKAKIAIEARYITIQSDPSKTNLIPVTAAIAFPLGK